MKANRSTSRATLGIAFLLLAGAVFVGFRTILAERPTVHTASQTSGILSESSRNSHRTRITTPPLATTPGPQPAHPPFSSHTPEPAPAPAHPGQSETTQAFMQARSRLQQDHQKLLHTLRNASPEEHAQTLEKWHQEHATELAAQQELAVRMGAETLPARLPIPAKPRIPENATPELREFLTARHAVIKDQMEMMNQLRDAPPEEQHQAMEKWHQANSGRLEAMQTTATKLSQSQPANPYP